MEDFKPYRIVGDKRNSKQSNGGKRVRAQGRILDRSERFQVVNKVNLELQPRPSEKDCRFVVAMNFKRGADVTEMIAKLATQLFPPSEHSRLAFIIGINEKSLIRPNGNSSPEIEWEDMGVDCKALEALGIPILLTFFQWTAYWENKDSLKDTASEIQAQMYAKIASIENARQKKNMLDFIRKCEEDHGYPFGAARTFLLNNPEAQKFISSFSHGKDVYIHIQDSDVINLQESLTFANTVAQDNALPHVPPMHQQFLFSQFDALISHFQEHQRLRPIVLGGAHVYNPDEDVVPGHNKISDKHATRFTSEVGNAFKHLIGIHQPYGLYFHEPNTLVLSPESAKRRAAEAAGELKIVYDRFQSKFVFGMDSELKDLTRNLFKDMSDDTCRTAMVFSSTTVLSTSMKRGSAKAFAIRCRASFEKKPDAPRRQFHSACVDDIIAMRGMSQEIIQSNKWMGHVAASFSNHRVADARREVCQLYTLFDPLEGLDPSIAASYYSALIEYDENLQKKQAQIQTVARELSQFYDKQKKGREVARQLLTIAWECGQMMRLMLLDHFSCPEKITVPSKIQKKLDDIRRFLASRFTFTFKPGTTHPVENPFISNLLGDLIVIQVVIQELAVFRDFTVTKDHVAEAAKWFLKLRNNQKVVMQQLGIGTPTTLKNVLGKNAPRTWPKIAEMMKTSHLVCQNFPNLSQSQRSELLTILSATY